MRVDGKLVPGTVEQIAEAARDHERAGYRGFWSAESKHDPFLPLVVAGEHTTTLELGTSIAVAFARTPMTLAYTSWDLQDYTGGRFLLGLGSQVKPHIERRFSMQWSRPAARMREMVAAIHAIWDSWENGTRLAFEGDFYRHTLMTPFFSPGPNPHGRPKVVVAAVGDAMCEVAGEVCDGIFLHPFITERYLREVILPAVQRGLTKAGRSKDSFEVIGLPLTATGADEEALGKAIEGVRNQLAFYASTPAYHGVLELHGWGDLGTTLHALSRTEDADWDAMGDLVDDDVLDAFAVVGAPGQIAETITSRFDDAMDRLQFSAPYPHEQSMWSPIVAELASTGRRKEANRDEQ